MNPIDQVRVRANEGETDCEREDVLAFEEPLEIRIRSAQGGPISCFVTTMRTPGNGEELTAGLLFAEGVVESPAELIALERPTDPRIDPELKAHLRVCTLRPEGFG